MVVARETKTTLNLYSSVYPDVVSTILIASIINFCIQIYRVHVYNS